MLSSLLAAPCCCRDPALDDDKGALHHARNQSLQGRISGAGARLALRFRCVGCQQARQGIGSPVETLAAGPFSRPSECD